MIVFVNDSHFAWKMFQPVVALHRERIQAVVISKKTRGRPLAALRVVRKCSKRYAVYRLLVDLLTRTNDLRGTGSVRSLAAREGLPIVHAVDVNANNGGSLPSEPDVGLALNFDQVVKKTTLDRFRHGILNAHASRLPSDRGISPAMWAYARGDSEVWVSIYQMDEGLDSGPLHDQFAVPILNIDSAFSAYERVCAKAGERLSGLLEAHYAGNLPAPTPQRSDGPSRTLRWPDHEFDRALRASGRRLITVRDVVSTWRT